MDTEKIENFRALLQEQGVSAELCDLAHDHNNALASIRMRGVPETRARYLPQALDVLLTRMDREIGALRHEQQRAEGQLRQYEAQSIPRTADVPADATQWIKYYDDRLGRYRCTWARQRGLFVDIFAAAPDYRPETDAACVLPVIDVEPGGSDNGA